MESNGLTEGIERSQPQRLTARTPAARISFKHAGTARAAFGATTVSGKMPCRYVIPITANEECATRVTLSSLAHGIVNIAGIDVMEASIPCDPSRFAQRLGRCRRSIGQFPVWMKGREAGPVGLDGLESGFPLDRLEAEGGGMTRARRARSRK